MKKSKSLVTMIFFLILNAIIPSIFYVSINKPSQWVYLPNGSPNEVFLTKNNINAWQDNGTPLCTELQDQKNAVACPDGQGGVIVAWEDWRSGSSIYAQRVNSSGSPLWGANGTLICTSGTTQRYPDICSDGSGGAIITWMDYRNDYDIYAQSINSSGNLQWAAMGVIICNENGSQNNPRICSDQVGGAFITWRDLRPGSNNVDIYAQRVDSNGVVQWLANGTPLCNEVDTVENVQIISDGNQGAIIAWQDHRNGINFDIYAQKINSTGTFKWIANGTSICTAVDTQLYPQLSNDGNGGAIIVWEDRRNGMDYDVYAKRINSTGNVIWNNNGTIIRNTNADEISPQITTDDDGGAIITWSDDRDGDYDVYAQRVNSLGELQWNANGITVCNAISSQNLPKICSDNIGGAYVTWTDWRKGVEADVYGQSINSEGMIQYPGNGLAICTEINGQLNNRIISDKSGGAIIVWEDARNGVDTDIYSQKVSPFLNKAPTSNHPDDIVTTQFLNESISWILWDDEGEGQYRIWVNDTNNNYYILKNWYQWINNTPINIQINRTYPGIFNYTIEFYDDTNRFNSDTIFVTVLNFNGIVWEDNGTPICNEVNDQELVVACPDGYGGVLMAWQDDRIGTSNDRIYAQRIDSTGTPLWGANGTQICSSSFAQRNPDICSDGNGGAIIAWQDLRAGSYDIYAQRVSASGIVSWIATGVAICNLSNTQSAAKICNDGSGGAFITWKDLRPGSNNYDIYAQRVNSNGIAQWLANGTLICNEIYTIENIQIMYDGNQSAIIVWEDLRTGGSNYDIYAQKINSTGNIQWLSNGTPICIDGSSQLYPQLCSDGNGGAMIVWEDHRDGTGNIYAQRINSTGVGQWKSGGTAICNASSDQYYPQITTDDNNGSIITWYDARSGPWDIYVQRINYYGAAQWSNNGTLVCNAVSNQRDPQVCSDGSSGAYIAWVDFRYGVANSDIFAQHVNSQGIFQYEANGTPICTASNNQDNIQIVYDKTGGAFIIWDDQREGSTHDIYAQKLSSYPGEAPTSNHPPDVTTSVMEKRTIDWSLFDNYYGGFYSVLVNDTNDNYYTWVAWTPWKNNTLLNVPINRTALGVFNYTIVYNDSQNYFGKTDTVLVTVTEAVLAWQINGIPICTAEGSQQTAQQSTQIVSDGAGGAIIVWEDYRNSNYDIYAQRINREGVVIWGANGTPICNYPNRQQAPDICSDGMGGVIITWQDNRSGNYDIYAQRVNSTGQVQWLGNGTPVCNFAAGQTNPRTFSDGAGGVIVAWQDLRYSNYDVFAQRIDANGNPKWSSNGTPVCTASLSQTYIDICSDGEGGAIIAWQDQRNSTRDIYVQRIDMNGTPQWHDNGTAVCTEINDQWYPQVVSDGNGGTIIAWEDERVGGISDVYAQRVRANGTIAWFPNGTAICTAPDDQGDIELAGDGLGNAIITWYDNRGMDSAIYAQRITGNGSVTWSPNGIPISNNTGNKYDPVICSDRNGGAFIAWEDYRNGLRDVYIQRINPDGTILWLKNGISLCNATGHQYSIQMTHDGGDAVILAWTDERKGSSNRDIFAQTTYNNLPPTSTHPADIFTTKTGSETINWMLHDDLDGSYYRVWANDTNDKPYLWFASWTYVSNGTTLYVPINRTAPGLYNYTIEYRDDKGKYGVPDMVYVTIQNAMPYPSPPSNMVVPIGGTENLSWTLHDDWGAGQYRVWANDSNDNYYVWQDWKSWINHFPIDVPINRTVRGTYNYTIEYYDSYALYGYPSTVMVTLDDYPWSDHPDNITTTAHGSETINWTLYDDMQPGMYQVWVNYSFYDGDIWFNNTPINVPIDRTAPGVYNYTITYSDTRSNGIPDTVFVNVTNLAPSSNHPAKIITTANDSEKINWTLYDDFDDLQSGVYSIIWKDYQNNTLSQSGWAVWFNNSLLQWTIDRTSPGVFFYEINYNDSLGKFGIPDVVKVTVQDMVPTTSWPGDFNTTANGTETINWTLSDDYGPGQYRVLVTDPWLNTYVWQDWDAWINNVQLNVTVNRTIPGEYNYTIEYNDSSSQPGIGNVVMVTVENLAPTSDHPSPIVTAIGSGATIEWTLHDDFGPGHYRVLVNDTNNNWYVLVNWTPWDIDKVFTVPINDTTAGIFNYTLEFNDTYGLFGVSDSVIVTVMQNNNGLKQLLSTGFNQIYQFDEHGFLWVSISIYVISDTNITITTNTTKPILFPNSTFMAFVFYDFVLDDPVFTNATIRFYYNESLLNGTDERSLKIYHYLGGNWVELIGTVDPDSNYIEIYTEDFSQFTLGFAPAGSAGRTPTFLPPSGGDNSLLYLIIGGISVVAAVGIGVAVKKSKGKPKVKKEKVKPTPVKKKVPELVKEDIAVKRAYDYIGGNIRYKVVVENVSRENIKNISVELDVKKQFQLDTPSIQKIELLEPGESRGSDFILVPLTCGKSRIHGTVSYHNVKDELITTEVAPSVVQIKCPLLTKRKVEMEDLVKLIETLQKSHTEIPYSGLAIDNAYQIAKEQVSSLDVLEVREDLDNFQIVFSGEAKVGGDIIIIDLNVTHQVIIIDVYLEDIKQATGFLAYIKNLINLAVQYSSKISTTMDAITNKIYNSFELASRLQELFNLCLEKAPVDDLLLLLKELKIKLNSYFPTLKITEIYSGLFDNWLSELEKIKDEIWERTYINLEFDMLNLMDAIITLSETNSKTYFETPTVNASTRRNIESGNMQLAEQLKNMQEAYSNNILFALMFINKVSGLSMYNYNFKEKSLDSDLIGGFLTAIQSFGSEVSAESKEKGMQRLSYKHFEIELAEGKYTMAALITSGIADPLTLQRHKEILQRFEKTFEKELEIFAGDVSKFENAKKLIHEIFFGQK